MVGGVGKENGTTGSDGLYHEAEPGVKEWVD